MNPLPDHGINDPDAQLDSAAEKPCTEALLAGTLALMTGHAQACCAEHKALMMKKIIVNLQMLSNHAEVSLAFRSVASNLFVMWTRLRQQGDAQAQEPKEAKEQKKPQQNLQPDAPAAAYDRPFFGRPLASSSQLPSVLWHAIPEIIQ